MRSVEIICSFLVIIQMLFGRSFYRPLILQEHRVGGQTSLVEDQQFKREITFIYFTQGLHGLYLYIIFRERNYRRYSGRTKPPGAIFQQIVVDIRAVISSFIVFPNDMCRSWGIDQPS